MISKKGNMNVLYSFVIGFVAVTMLTGLALQVLGDTKGDMTANSAEYNATGEGIAGLTTLAEKYGTIAAVIGFVVIIGYFAYIKMK